MHLRRTFLLNFIEAESHSWVVQNICSFVIFQPGTSFQDTPPQPTSEVDVSDDQQSPPQDTPPQHFSEVDVSVEQQSAPQDISLQDLSEGQQSAPQDISPQTSNFQITASLEVVSGVSINFSSCSYQNLSIFD